MTTLQRCEKDVNTYLMEELKMWMEKMYLDNNYGVTYRPTLKNIRISKSTGEAFITIVDEDGMGHKEFVPDELQEIAQVIAK